MTDERHPLSVSQYNTYAKCPYSWFLQKKQKAWQRPAAWLAQGTAVHKALEEWERSGRSMSLEDAQDVFRTSYQEEINGYCEITPNFDWWFASGPYGGEEDTERRYHIGLEQVEKCLGWYDKHPEEVIWVAPDGTSGIELGFDIDLDGVAIRGYIDAVITDDSGNTVCRDNKTGNTPGDDFQLGVYAVALAEAYGVEKPETGDYFMAGKKGKKAAPTYPYDLKEWTRERVVTAFKELEANIKAERFEPKPTPDGCRFCSVSNACEYRSD